MRTVVTHRSCLDDLSDYPVAHGFGSVDNVIDHECSSKFELCADSEAAGKLAAYIAAVQRWMKQAALACRKDKP